MQNSIQGPLLRSGKNSSFKALGETGYPVFKMAFQLRAAIARFGKQHDLARHLAIPQNDQGGDNTDWYSSFSGDVISWQHATESERESARQQFADFRDAVQSLSEEQLRTAAEKNAGGDRQVFAQLLKLVVNFPSDEFLYLVDGVLVITFWGFIHQHDELRDPMHWLAQPATSEPVPTPTPSSAVNIAKPTTVPVKPRVAPVIPETVPVTETTDTTRRRWLWGWPRWLWLLLPLLLLGLLFFLLRGCVPTIPGIPWLADDNKTHLPAVDLPNAPDQTLPDGDGITVPSIKGHLPTINLPTIGGGGAGGSSAAEPLPADGENGGLPLPAATDNNGNDADANADAAAPTGGDPTAGTDPAALPDADAKNPAPLTNPMPLPDDNTDAANSNGAEQQPVTAPNPLPSDTAPQGKPLTLPAKLPDGPAQFLNGQWRVNGGIQDKQTGRPLQLQYQFDQGKGTVSVHQSNGVTCTGAANGSVQQGALNITNPKQMQCSDGSTFMGPTIQCQSPASGHADCVGSNDGDKTFPIRMLQPNS